ncbi:hypothetical protein [Sphingobacterium faecale]|uniref:Uncharacterized protein n=1 Tax=Sphingobacterium faecale TaxID=2803775 RepID=A0ABS1R7W3_9SPHI|nr:hypothetical protein [Sphingobacterium faecale]MBL1410807.1 hypothetical protein [Sphingobacterium faecale]
MSKYLILQQLQHIKELVISSLTGEELTALSIQEHLSLLLEHADVQELCENDQQRFLKLLKRLFPEWTIEPLPVPPPERVDIAY